MRVVLNSFNLDEAEKTIITTALTRGGSLLAAARLLGITRASLKRRMLRLRIAWPENNIERPPRVFISYSHDLSEDVLGVAQQLRRSGVDAVIDRFVVSPPEGWPRWTAQQIAESDYVLVVCSGQLKRNLETSDARDWEAKIIKQELYNGALHNTKLVPILLQGAGRGDIPTQLAPYKYYQLPNDFEFLLRHLTNQPEAAPAPLGLLKRIPVRQDEFAEQKSQCISFFRAAQWRVVSVHQTSSLGGKGPPVEDLFAEPSLAGERRRVSGLRLAFFRAPPTADDVERLWNEIENDQADTSHHAPVLGVFIGPPPNQSARTVMARAASKNVRLVSLSPEWIVGGLARGRVQAELDALLGAWVSRDDPFAINLPVIAPGDFFPRRRDADLVLRALDRGQSVGLFGLRKIGKTSLARWVLGQRAGLTVEIDAQRFADRCGPLLQALPGEILRAARRLDPQSTWPLLESVPGDLDLLTSAVGAYVEDIAVLTRARTGQEIPITLFIDEIDRLVHAARRNGHQHLQEFERLFGLIRALGQRDPPVLTTLVSGFSADVTRLDRALGEGIAGNPVYRFFAVQRLGPMSRDVLDQMMGELGARAGLEFDDPALGRVMYWSGGHPWLARQIGSHLLRVIGERTGLVRVTSGQIDAVASHMLNDRDCRRDLRELLHRVDDAESEKLLAFVAAHGDEGISLSELPNIENETFFEESMVGGLLNVRKGRCSIFAGLVAALIRQV